MSEGKIQDILDVIFGMKGKHEKTHEATKRILSEKVEYQGALEKTIAGLRGEIARYDERFR